MFSQAVISFLIFIPSENQQKIKKLTSTEYESALKKEQKELKKNYMPKKIRF